MTQRTAPRHPIHAATMALVCVVIGITAGCQRAPEATRPVVSTSPQKPVTPPPPATAPATSPAVEQPAEKPPSEPRKPKRPPLTWTKFVGAFDNDKDAAIEGRADKSRIEIRTQNVQRLLIDLRELPPELRRKGPWNLQIDQQGIEITGRRGWMLELSRNDSGAWTVTGPKPPPR